MKALLIRGLGGLGVSNLHIWILQLNCSVLMGTPGVGVRQSNCSVQLNRCNSGTFCFHSIILFANSLSLTLVAACEFFLSYFFNSYFAKCTRYLIVTAFSRLWTLPEVSEMAIPNERKGKESELMVGDCSIRKVIYSLASVNS